MSEIELDYGNNDCEILCADSSSTKLVTGDDNNEIVLWDKNKIVNRCRESADDPVTSLCFSNKQPEHIYAAIKDQVVLLDTRYFKRDGPVEAKISEEINQICLSANDHFMAIANDSNYVYVKDRQENALRRLKGHTNASYTVQFRNNCSRRELVSGGFDCKLINWNYSNLKRINTYDFNKTCENEAFINPPFVLSTAFNNDCSILACGCGNSEIKLFDCSQKDISYLSSLTGAHTYSVCQVHFPKFAPNILISGGNDGQINMWDIENYSDSSKSLKSTLIHHNKKINWLSSIDYGEDGRFIVVCDTFSKVSLHRFPE